MTETRFTAPAAGYYLFLPGQPPRLLTEEEAAEPFADVAARYSLLHLWEGDTLMNSGGGLSTAVPTGPTLTLDWGRE
jgi:hypothetical protein